LTTRQSAVLVDPGDAGGNGRSHTRLRGAIDLLASSDLIIRKEWDMPQKFPYESFGGNAAENYERYFVPAIGGPVARDLIQVAALRPGERVLDVACGTGVVTRLAAEQVGDAGSVAGSDINPGMLAVARASVPPDTSIRFYETAAEAMPLPDNAFDVVLCQMGLQFFSNKPAALREMARVLAPGGRLVLNLPGPTPEAFSVLADALRRHVDPQVASFMHLVFSLHDPSELQALLTGAGFRDVDIQAAPKRLRLPPPQQFLWQYVHSTPLAEPIAQLDEPKRNALERDVCDRWKDLVTDGAMEISVRMTTATGHKVAA
jgi:ubiquinone/menaquinone biosynthesis C-methylase UbiE